MRAWFLRQVREEEDFLRSVWFSDEAHFYFSGTENSRNYVHWATERPDEVIERNLHVTKATAWLALSAQGVIGPFWFCNEDGATETVTADRYMNVLTRFWRALGRFCGHEARGQQWVMQDKAAPHTARRVLTWLSDHFEGLINRFTEKTWASHSLDLNPLDFFLWGHLKDQISGEQFQTLNDLKFLSNVWSELTHPRNVRTPFKIFSSECGDVFREMVAILNSFYSIKLSKWKIVRCFCIKFCYLLSEWFFCISVN